MGERFVALGSPVFASARTAHWPGSREVSPMQLLFCHSSLSFSRDSLTGGPADFKGALRQDRIVRDVRYCDIKEQAVLDEFPDSEGPVDTLDSTVVCKLDFGGG